MSPIERPRYFDGQLLDARDFEDEQAYFRERIQRLNRCLHGAGIACGLETSIEDGKVVVAPGMALDCEGREIVIDTRVRIELPIEPDKRFLTLCYDEEPTRPVVPPPSGGSETGEQEERFSRIRETFRLEFLDADDLSGHDRCRGAWKACGEKHPLPIARIDRRRNRIDPHFDRWVRCRCLARLWSILRGR